MDVGVQHWSFFCLDQNIWNMNFQNQQLWGIFIKNFLEFKGLAPVQQGVAGSSRTGPTWSLKILSAFLQTFLQLTEEGYDAAALRSHSEANTRVGAESAALGFLSVCMSERWRNGSWRQSGSAGEWEETQSGNVRMEPVAAARSKGFWTSWVLLALICCWSSDFIPNSWLQLLTSQRSFQNKYLDLHEYTEN